MAAILNDMFDMTPTAIVNSTNINQVVIVDFFIIKRVNRLLEITITISNHTYAKTQHLLPHLQLLL